MSKNRAVQVVFSNELELYSFRSIQIQISPQKWGTTRSVVCKSSVFKNWNCRFFFLQWPPSNCRPTWRPTDDAIAAGDSSFDWTGQSHTLLAEPAVNFHPHLFQYEVIQMRNNAVFGVLCLSHTFPLWQSK